LFGYSYYHMNFRTSVSVSTKNLARVLIDIILNVLIYLGRVDVLTVLNLPTSERSVSLHFIMSYLVSLSNVFDFHCTGLFHPLLNVSLSISYVWWHNGIGF
jgi:hypothetical protein